MSSSVSNIELCIISYFLYLLAIDAASVDVLGLTVLVSVNGNFTVSATVQIVSLK